MHLPFPENLSIGIYIAMGLTLALPLILLNIKLAPTFGWLDWPKARGLSDRQVPLVGLSLVLGSLIYLSILATIGKASGFLVASTLIIAVMGYLDDRSSRPAFDKLLVQLFCVTCVVLFDPALQKSIVQNFGPWGTFGAIFFILGLMNSINFIDGIDGLAGMVLFLGALGLYLFGMGLGEAKTIVAYGGILMGMLVPFLYFNVISKKAFLGNVGSYTLSYLLAVQHLSLPLDSPHAITRLSLSGLCFLIPIADALTVLGYRLSSRRSPFQADKGHLHHRLLQASLSVKHILWVLGTIEVFGVLIGFLMSRASQEVSLWLAPAICFTQTLTVGLLIVLVEKTSKRRVQSYFSHLDQGKPVFYLKYLVSQANGKPLSDPELAKLEARINAEIRVTDLCFRQAPSTLFVTLRNLSEPMKGLSARIDRIFEEEKIRTALTIEQGEFIKVSERTLTPRLSQVLPN